MHDNNHICFMRVDLKHRHFNLIKPFKTDYIPMILIGTVVESSSFHRGNRVQLICSTDGHVWRYWHHIRVAVWEIHASLPGGRALENDKHIQTVRQLISL